MTPVADRTTADMLIVHHTPSPAVQTILEAAVAGCRHAELAEVTVRQEPALSAGAADLLAADSLLLITPANIGYMSGALKHFFDTVYYPCLTATTGLGWAGIVHGNDDTAGAVRSVERIASALGWRQVGPTLSSVGNPSSRELASVGELAATVAAAALGL